MAKPGLDGHDRGVKVIARALRDAGMEVIYTGLRQSPDDIVVAGGGIIPPEDIPKLKKAGLKGVFGPGTSLQDIVEFFQKNAGRSR